MSVEKKQIKERLVYLLCMPPHLDFLRIKDLEKDKDIETKIEKHLLLLWPSILDL